MPTTKSTSCCRGNGKLHGHEDECVLGLAQKRLKQGTDEIGTVSYFGCIERAGHYWWEQVGHRQKIGRNGPPGNPWNDAIDGGLLSKGAGQVQGLVTITHKDGWTALSFWDRSVDTRGGCNSNFIAEGTWDFDELLKAAREQWPFVFERFTFTITDSGLAAGGSR